MEIQPIDMTTPLNLEMLKELRATLAELTKQREMDDRIIMMSPEPGLQQGKEITMTAIYSVMRAITSLCNPIYSANGQLTASLPEDQP